MAGVSRCWSQKSVIAFVPVWLKWSITNESGVVWPEPSGFWPEPRCQ